MARTPLKPPIRTMRKSELEDATNLHREHVATVKLKCEAEELIQPYNDPVHNPSHYKLFPDLETIDAIRKLLTDEEFRGYCKGSILKYRLRAGKKGSGTTLQDIAKADVYNEWLNETGAKINSDRKPTEPA